MNKEIVQVVFRGKGPINVSRAKLAENMRFCQCAVRSIGLRPGEPTGKLYGKVNAGLSADLVATGRTIISEHAKQSS